MTRAIMTRLDNGVRIVTHAMPGIQTAAVSIIVGVGSRHEPAELNGAAHFLEHMLFKGTARRSARDIAVTIEDVGGYLNGWEAPDHACYHAAVLAEDSPLALAVLADMVLRPTLDAGEMETERGVVLEEIARWNDRPDWLVHSLLQRAAFADHPLGRPVLGTPNTVGAMTAGDLRRFHDRHYFADGAIVVAVAGGNVMHGRIEDLAHGHFGHIEVTAPIPFAAARWCGGTAVADYEAEQVHVALGFEGAFHGEAWERPLSVLLDVLAGGMSSRLFQEVREKRGLVYEIGSCDESFVDTGKASIHFGSSPAAAAEALRVVCEGLASIADTVTEAEVERAKAGLRVGALRRLESPEALRDTVAMRTLFLDGPRSPLDTAAEYEAVTIDEVRAAARRLIASPPALAMVGPLGGELARITADDVSGWIGGGGVA